MTDKAMPPWYFNPRSRVGSDIRVARTGWEHKYFNPRSRVGSDVIGGEIIELELEISIHAPAWGATV